MEDVINPGKPLDDDVIIPGTPFVDVVMMPLVDTDVVIGVDGWWMDVRGREEGGGGGIDSEGAPSGLRCASVVDLLSSFISAARTCSN